MKGKGHATNLPSEFSRVPVFCFVVFLRSCLWRCYYYLLSHESHCEQEKRFLTKLSCYFKINKPSFLFFVFSDSITGYGATANSFIYSLHNKEGKAPFKSSPWRPSVAIYKLNDFGPTFGQGHDIKIANNANTNSQSP